MSMLNFFNGKFIVAHQRLLLSLLQDAKMILKSESKFQIHSLLGTGEGVSVV
jgi:hypothetical protein